MQLLGKIRDALDALGKILLFSQAQSFPLASLSPARFPLSPAFPRTSLLCTWCVLLLWFVCECGQVGIALHDLSRLRLRPVDGIEWMKVRLRCFGDAV